MAEATKVPVKAEKTSCTGVPGVAAVRDPAPGNRSMILMEVSGAGRSGAHSLTSRRHGAASWRGLQRRRLTSRRPL